MYSSKKWLSGLMGVAVCLLLTVTDKQDVCAGRDYTINSYVVCMQGTKLYEEPDCDSTAVIDIPAGGVATVVENDEIYTKVNYNGVTGYLYQEFIGYDEAAIAAYEAELLAKSEEVRAIAAIIQCEAGSEVYEGQVAVGAVVMNRVKSPAYPNTITEVIHQPNQFGPADSQTYANLMANDNIKESCRTAAMEAFAGVDTTGGALHFKRAGSREGLVIGNHVFY